MKRYCHCGKCSYECRQRARNRKIIDKYGRRTRISVKRLNPYRDWLIVYNMDLRGPRGVNCFRKNHCSWKPIFSKAA
jgi:hypothetical protein